MGLVNYMDVFLSMNVSVLFPVRLLQREMVKFFFLLLTSKYKIFNFEIVICLVDVFCQIVN